MSIKERTARAYALLAILSTAPRYIFDLFDYQAFGEYRLHPMLVEQLLSKRGQFDGMKSIKENIEIHYGAKAAELAESLI